MKIIKIRHSESLAKIRTQRRLPSSSRVFLPSSLYYILYYLGWWRSKRGQGDHVLKIFGRYRKYYRSKTRQPISRFLDLPPPLPVLQFFLVLSSNFVFFLLYDGATTNCNIGLQCGKKSENTHDTF